MGQFFGVIFGIYMICVFVTWPIFWFKKTDRSQAPIVRRAIGLGYGLIWPVAIFQFFAGRNAAEAAEAERRAAQSRILGTPGGRAAGPTSVPPQVIPPQAIIPPQGGVPPVSAPGPTASRIANPFDQH